ncbi:hypothetical protein SLS60_002335 [Paraconiothyrium brasiliense]|uniref:Aquaporin-like protein n=1 Tax=Paraconiothyrium brasiliense TaxID=300254 RepID=A0ABR3S1X0_9PLEO
MSDEHLVNHGTNPTRIANVDETYARYERSPFRNYSLKPSQGNQERVNRQKSKASLMNRFNSVRSKLGSTNQGGSNGRTKSGRRPKPDYSLAGPSPYDEQQDSDEYDSDEGFGDYGRRPPAIIGLGKPFPRQKRGGRWRKRDNVKKPKQAIKGSRTEKGTENGKPEGQVGGGPAGHHGSPVRGRPLGETAGGPAGHGRDPEDEDEHGNTNWIEQVADANGRHNSEQTLNDEDEGDEDDDGSQPNFWFGIRRQLREPLAEWLGTLVSVLMGVCANLQMKTSDGKAGSFAQSAAMWGIGTMMAVYIAGGISGAHCNPMVSINLAVFRGFPARKAFIYICSQILGAICAVWIAYGIYHDAILYFDPEKKSTSDGSGTAFFTLPAPFATPQTAFWTDFTSAAVMSGTVMAMGDDTNSPPGAGMHAFIIALIGFAMASCLGYNTGPQTNPAKDLATRFVPNVVGYGSDMWVQGWWAEAWAAAIFGGLFGCLVYDVAIFEGPESPINYPRAKRQQSREGNKAKWLKTGWFGAGKKHRAEEDLENGVGINEKNAGHQMDGH